MSSRPFLEKTVESTTLWPDLSVQEQIFLILLSPSFSFCLSFPTDCLLGPIEDDPKGGDDPSGSPAHMPPILTHSHPNAFHVWDQDDVVIPLSPDLSPQASPLLAVVPYISHFFPPYSSHTNSPSLPQSHSLPGESMSPREAAYAYP